MAPDFTEPFRDPPKAIRRWILFAALMSIVYALNIKPGMTNIQWFRLALELVICWMAVPATLLFREQHTWQYYKNIGVFNMAVVAASAVVLGLSPSTELPARTEITELLTTSLAISAIIAILTLREKKREDAP